VTSFVQSRTASVIGDCVLRFFAVADERLIHIALVTRDTRFLFVAYTSAF
jgi:hypothetical protein